MTSCTENELRQRITELSGIDASWQSFGVIDDQVQKLREDLAKYTKITQDAGIKPE